MARAISLTRPMAMAHRAGSSWLPRALYKKGLNCSMYLTKSSSIALAIAPTVAKITSGTLDLAPTVWRTWSRTVIMRSAWGLISVSKRWTMARMTLIKLVCISSRSMRSSALTTCCCIGMVCSRRWRMTSERVATIARLSLAELRTKELRTSYPAVRSWLSASCLWGSQLR